MINTRFFYTEKKPLGFKSEGHSGFAEAGQDIVCAAVSAVLQSALLGLTHYLPQGLTFRVESGYLNCSIKEKDISSFTDAILNTATLSVLNIALQYPEYLTFTIEDLTGWQNKSEYTQEDYKKLSSILM